MLYAIEFYDDLSKIIDDYVEIDGQILNILSFIILFILTSFLFTIAIIFKVV